MDREQPHTPDDDAIKALTYLLADLFNPPELRQWVRANLGREVFAELPGESSSLATLSFEIALTIARRGLGSPTTFSALAAKCPNRADEIMGVAHLWGVGLKPPLNPPTPKNTPRQEQNSMFPIWAAAILCIILFACGMLLTLLVPCPSQGQAFAQRVTWALTAGLMSAAIFGRITLNLKLGAALELSAVGGAAFFTLIYSTDPASNFGSDSKCMSAPAHQESPSKKDDSVLIPATESNTVPTAIDAPTPAITSKGPSAIKKAKPAQPSREDRASKVLQPPEITAKPSTHTYKLRKSTQGMPEKIFEGMESSADRNACSYTIEVFVEHNRSIRLENWNEARDGDILLAYGQCSCRLGSKAEFLASLPVTHRGIKDDALEVFRGTIDARTSHCPHGHNILK